MFLYSKEERPKDVYITLGELCRTQADLDKVVEDLQKLGLNVERYDGEGLPPFLQQKGHAFPDYRPAKGCIAPVGEKRIVTGDILDTRNRAEIFVHKTELPIHLFLDKEGRIAYFNRKDPRYSPNAPHIFVMGLLYPQGSEEGMYCYNDWQVLGSPKRVVNPTLVEKIENFDG